MLAGADQTEVPSHLSGDLLVIYIVKRSKTWIVLLLVFMLSKSKEFANHLLENSPNDEEASQPCQKQLQDHAPCTRVYIRQDQIEASGNVPNCK